MSNEFAKRILLILSAFMLLFPYALLSQEAQKNAKEDKKTTNLRIEVTGADDNSARPVERAEVYVESKVEGVDFEPQTKKTDRNGVVRFSGVPRGKVLIQVIAEGWHNFGDTFELNQENQTVKLRLKKQNDS